MLLSLGLRRGGLSSARNYPSSIVVSPPYDSLGELTKTNAAQFNTQAEIFFTDSTVASSFNASGSCLWQSTAQAISGGSTNFWINDNGTRSAQYAAEYAAITQDISTINTVLLYGGTNDANPASGITKTLYKQGLEKFLEFIKEDFINLQNVFLVPLHRSLDASASDTNYQEIKEAQFEFVAQNSIVKTAGEIYDRDIAASPDNVHPSASEFQNEIARRHAEQIAKSYKRPGAIGASGPQVTSASFETDHILLSITHDHGTDLSMISGCEEAFAFDVNGTVIKPSSIERASAITLKAHLDNTGFITPDQNDSFKIGYGAMKNLSRTSPAVVKDNAVNPLPLRQSVITPTLSDPLIGMDFTFDVSPKAARTMSGSDLTELISRDSTGTFTSSSGRYGTFETSNNGAVIADATTSYRSPAFTASGDSLTFIVWDMPASLSSNFQPLSFGGSTSGQSAQRTALSVSSSIGTLSWGQNESSQFEPIVSDCRGEKAVICVHHKSTSNCDIYYNSTGVTVNFNPRDNMTTQTYLWLMALSHAANSNAGFKLHRVWFRNKKHGEVGDAAISDIITYLAGHYGVGLS